MHGTAAHKIVLLVTLLAGCIPAIDRTTLDEAFIQKHAGTAPWTRVAVLPFSGAPQVRRPAEEWMSFRIRELGYFKVIGPFDAGRILARNGISISEQEVPLEVLSKAGVALDVDGIILATTGRVPVLSQAMGGGLYAGSIVSVKIYERASGTFVASSIQQSAYPSEAIDRTLKAVLPTLQAAVGMKVTLPARKEPPPPREEVFP